MENVSQRLDRKFAIDCDGVLFDFNSRMAEYCNNMYNTTLPLAGSDYPDKWDWPLDQLSKEQYRKVWNSICEGEDNYEFWRHLPTFKWSSDFARKVTKSAYPHVFITSRCGRDCQRATSHALQAIGFINPAIIVASKKARHILDLQCTDFLDDKPENFDELQSAGGSNVACWILDQPWNRSYNPSWIRRIYDPVEMLG